MDTIGLIGQGLIYQQVQRQLANAYHVLECSTESAPEQLARCQMLLYCRDTWQPEELQKVNRRCLQAGVAWLPVFTQFDEAVIGPCVVPQKPGCTSCAELRKLGATSSEPERELLRQYLSYRRKPASSQPWLSSFSLNMLAALVHEEVATYLCQPEQVRTECALLSVALASLECRRHPFLPFPTCPDCARPVRDRADLAAITLQARPKADASTYRVAQPAASPQEILATYVDERVGLVSALVGENTNLLPLASSRLSVETETTAGTGCTFYPEQSKLVSVLEVIERYAGLRPRGKRTMVRASYHQLLQHGEPALDPTTLGLHSPEQYAQQGEHGHACRRLVDYHHDLVCQWVWGYSFQQQSPILVPEHCAYYGVPANAENPAFVFEISNGCALGNCLEEAIFHGMLEVVERDAFLLTWYARLNLPRLDLRSVTDPKIRLLLEHLEYHAGYTISAFNMTLDHAIPCLCLLGVDEQNQPGKPKALVAAGSHPLPEQALLKALREFAMYLAFPRSLDQQTRAEALALLADASLVQRMDQHPQIYYLPEAFDRLGFLYHSQSQQSFQEAFPALYQQPPQRLDLRNDLQWLSDFYLKQGREIIVVDQTAPEHAHCGLHCVKVLMPGMLPMTFGQHNRRVTGFERLHQLPLTLGYQDHPLTEAEINPHPHPFF